MLDFIYYPVSFIMWCWHWVFGHVFGESSAIAWALSIIFLVFTLRAIMFKPMVKQVRSMRKMQEFAPEIKKLQKKYANDKQKQAQEMQKLQSEHGVSPLGGCLPMLLQIPVFIGLFHVLREFKPGKTENYFFDERGVTSYVDANLFGARLSNWITQPQQALAEFGVQRSSVILVAIPLMLLASALTHLTARHSVARQNPAAATAQTGLMNKLTLYVFPLGVLLGGFFFPIGLIMYWLSNNGWTLWQQRFVYKRIDAEEAAKKTAVIEKRAANAPRPGAKPTQPKKRPAPVKPADDDVATEQSAPSSEPATTTPSTSTTATPPAKAPGSNGTGGTEIPGLIAGRSRSKKSGRKNR
ncbi:membrane protein insertase YidC [Actinokineospora sp. NBRC 105648]|uniref:membrane protein insertase YidC n=1 Tax=Actinokineospora sp. NBRC 105648 TaxID=3032206 RepID=UPI0024A3C359|nr:membrane protein insertase YidC [Actinokineospora sp. NBRC 105648]GLZ37387.1 membrane protein insertase YidC [Actinokineospora sp. NBRC 105648]